MEETSRYCITLLMVAAYCVISLVVFITGLTVDTTWIGPKVSFALQAPRLEA